MESVSGEVVCINQSAKEAKFTFNVDVTSGLNVDQPYWYKFESETFSELNVADVQVYVNGEEKDVYENKGYFVIEKDSGVESISVVGTIGTERRFTKNDAISLTVGTDETFADSITDTQQIKAFDESLTHIQILRCRRAI